METSTHRKRRCFGFIQEHDQTTGCYRHKHKQGANRAHKQQPGLEAISGRRDSRRLQGGKPEPEAKTPMPWKWNRARQTTLWSASNAGNRGTWPEIAGHA